jgi:hypothetical protein
MDEKQFLQFPDPDMRALLALFLYSSSSRLTSSFSSNPCYRNLTYPSCTAVARDNRPEELPCPKAAAPAGGKALPAVSFLL